MRVAVRRPALHLPLIGLLALAGSAPLSAADASAPAPGTTTPAALTLDEALRRAERDATTVAVARARLDQALAVERQAWSLLKPSVTLNGSYGTVSSRTYEPYGSPSVQTLAGGAEVALTLFNAAAYPGLRGADAQIAQQRAASRDLRRGLAFSVTGAFLEVLSSEQVKAVTAKRVEVAVKLLDEAKARKGAGLALASDISRAEVELANAQLELTKADRAITANRLALLEVLGGGDDVGPLVLPAAPQIPDPATAPVEALVQQAISQRDDLTAARRGLEVNQARVDSTNDQFWPTVTAKAGARGQDDNGNGTTQSPQWTASLNAQWALYDGGLRSGQAEEQMAQGRELRANLKASELSVRTTVRTTLLDIGATDTAVMQAETAKASAITNAEETMGRFRAGLATANDVADATLRAAQAAVEVERGRIAALKARYALRQALGQWPLEEMMNDELSK